MFLINIPIFRDIMFESSLFIDTSMKYTKIQWICLAIFLLVALTFAQDVNGQKMAGSFNKILKQLSDLKDENIGVIKEGTQALRELNEQHKKEVNDQIDQATSVIQQAINATHDLMPSVSALLTNVLTTINDYKKEAAGGIAGLITAFQMIFGGGVSYLTSKIKNLSKHKRLIQQGFDLQFRMFQKQEMKILRKIEESPSFSKLFQFLDNKGKKLVKVVIGTNGMGFTSNLQEWVKRKNQADRYNHYIYYDMSESPIRFNNAQENTHMDCISAIVYSLLHRQDRNIILYIFKGITSNAFEFLVGIVHAVTEYPVFTILYVSSFFFLRVFFYLATLYLIAQRFILPVSRTVFLWLDNIIRSIEGILTNKPTKKRQVDFKIVIDNFHVLESEFKERYKDGKLKNIVNTIEKHNQPAAAIPDNSTYEQHREYFEQSLTSLFNNIVALQRSNGTAQKAEIIVIIENSQFYKQYIENLRLNSPNPFIVKRFSQLPARDALHIIGKCTTKLVNVRDSPNKVNGIDITKYIRLFNNNSKVITRILQEVELDTECCEQNGSPKKKEKECVKGNQKEYKTKIQNIADIIRASMSSIIVHALHLQQLASLSADNNRVAQQNPKNKQKPIAQHLDEDSYLRYVGLFLGCVHKQLLFFASRSEGMHDETFKSDYEELIGLVNDRDNFQLDMLSTMSIGNRNYLFKKEGDKISLRSDAENLIMKWDNLIDYIRGDNNWEDSLREDFVKYFIENRILTEKLKKSDHQAVHTQLKDWLNRPKQAGQGITGASSSPLSAIASKNLPNTILNRQTSIFSQPDDQITILKQGETINKENFDAQGRKIFDEIINFLTQKNIISENIFFSRSMALANYYMQQKVKEKILYQKFLMNKCQLAVTIKIIADFRSKHPDKHLQIQNFSRKTNRKFEKFIKHEANTFEQGMEWLRWYYLTIPNCGAGDSVIQIANKYLLRRTNNSYVLKPSVNDILLYWGSFYNKLDLKQIEKYLQQNGIVKDDEQSKDYLNFLQATPTVCAHWLFQCKLQEEKISAELLGCQCTDLAAAVEGLQSLQSEIYKQKRIQNKKSDQVKKQLSVLLSGIYSHFLAAFSLNAPEREVSRDMNEILNSSYFVAFIKGKAKQKDFDDVNKLLFEYRELLKTYHPDGLFKELRNNYHSCLYQFCYSRSYKLSNSFQHLLMAFHYVKKNFIKQDEKAEKPSQKQAQATDFLAKKLADTNQQLLGNFYLALQSKDWLLMIRNGQRLKSKLRKLLKDDKSTIKLPLIESTLLIDLKAQLAAFCFASS